MSEPKIQKIGMVGVGSMGSMMSLLFAEHGYHVFFFDIEQSKMDDTQSKAQDVNLHEYVVGQDSYSQLCKSVSSDSQPRLIVFSIPHGLAGDKCLQGLLPSLTTGDIVLDCSNENYKNTERRQEELRPYGIFYVGCGVSGGYQSARAGPSMSPGGDREAVEKILSILRTVAAKDEGGRPCVNYIGPGGSGHFVKMLHNGIEQGMMSVIAEAWYILTRGLGLSYDEAGQVLRQWNESPELSKCFLIAIGADVNREKDDKSNHVVSYVQDKVVQDVDESEGTGTWTCEEAVRLHSPAATILSAHLFRCASADLKKRMKTEKVSKGTFATKPLQVDDQDSFIEQLRMATYFCFLLCFVQGLNLLRQKSEKKGWEINYPDLLHVWSAGSIIRADGIMSLLQSICSWPRMKPDGDGILTDQTLEKELSRSFDSTKNVVLKAVEGNMIIPAISQSLEYYKYSTHTELPTQFMEAELDYFGHHNFDIRGHGPGEAKKGSHHHEWKPAKGTSDK
ncbi:unnamed protein product [Clonostachys byssicola]|uniref:6-phosphogluconate dehydrogenase, decarboxylating n=1 Tax=Clonostachys byssicola TaxID=160290 RepID=A0A9N9UM87_9HYPO|nr:unnamed protein product [Clonostachys byssicola]